MRISTLFITCASVFLAADLLGSRVEAASLKCGTEMVSDGASFAEVLARCGEPATREHRSHVVEQRLNPAQKVYVTVEVDEWLYVYGSHRLSQRLIFENGKLLDVRSEGYGR